MIAVPKERRIGLPNSRYLIHQPLGQMRGVATDIEIHAKEMERTKAILNKIIADQTGKSVEEVTADTNRDYWLNAEEAIEYGLVSRIVSSRKDLEK